MHPAGCAPQGSLPPGQCRISCEPHALPESMNEVSGLTLPSFTYPSSRWLRAVVDAVILTVILVLFLVGTIPTRSPSGSFAYGCDDFAYQRQAELIRSDGLLRGLDTRIETADTRALIAVAQDSGVQASDWQQILGPHCHHVDAHSGRVIAQYPPGTPLVLSIFPRGTAGYGAYLVLAIGVCLAGLLLLEIGMPSILQLVIAMPFVFEAARYFRLPTSWASFSVGISAGLIVLLTALLLVRCRRRVSSTMLYVLFGTLAGLLLAVRLPNLFVIIGLAIAFTGRFEIHRLPVVRQRWPEILAGGAAFLVAGPMLVAAGNRSNTGSFLHTTYGSADATGVVWSYRLVVHHLRFYLVSCSSAVLVDMSLIAVAVACIASCRGAGGHLFRWATAAAAATTVTSVLFFLTHGITAPYYLVPSSIFSVAILAIMAPRGAAAVRLAYRPAAACVGTALLFVAVAYRMPKAEGRPPFSFSIPQEVLAPGVIVWSDLTSGSLLYYNHKVASKIVFGSACERLRLIASAHRAGAQQYLVDDSPAMHDEIAILAGMMKLRLVGDYSVFRSLPVWKIDAIPENIVGCA